MRGLFTGNGHSPHKGLVDSTSAEQSWVRKARAWFLKVTLANTVRAPLGPCARCGGIELNTVVRAGSRMCLVCSYSAEVVDMEEENQCPPRRRLPRREPSTRDLLTSEETSHDQDPGGCLTVQLRKGGTPETDSSGATMGVTRRDPQPSPPAAAGCGVLPGERDTMHLRNSKGLNGVLRETGEVGVHKKEASGARRVVVTTAAPLGGAAQGVPTRESQDATNVLGQAREAQQRTRQSRRSGGRGDGEGGQAS